MHSKFYNKYIFVFPYQYVHPTVPLLPVPPDGQLHAVASSLHQLVLQNIKIVFSKVNYM